MGIKLEYPYGDHESILPEFKGEEVEIKLPGGFEASKLLWFSVWCRQFDVSFGDIYFERLKTRVREVTEVGELSSHHHGVQVNTKHLLTIGKLA